MKRSATGASAWDGYAAAEAGGDDCLDTDRDAHPGGTELWYDGVDQDCDGNDGDQDDDGHDDPRVGGGDCDDGDAAVSPDAEEVWYDGEDGDCSGPAVSQVLVLNILRSTSGAGVYNHALIML